MSEKFAYTLAEVAELTGFSLRTMLDDCRAKPPRLAHIKRGNTYAMTREQIDAMLAAHTVAATQEPDRTEAHRQKVAAMLQRPANRQRKNAA